MAKRNQGEDLLPLLYYTPEIVLNQAGYAEFLYDTVVKVEEGRGDSDGFSGELLQIMRRAYDLFLEEARAGRMNFEGDRPTRAALAAEAVQIAASVRQAFRNENVARPMDSAFFGGYTLSRILSELGLWRQLQADRNFMEGRSLGGKHRWKSRREELEARNQKMIQKAKGYLREQRPPHEIPGTLAQQFSLTPKWIRQILQNDPDLSPHFKKSGS